MNKKEKEKEKEERVNRTFRNVGGKQIKGSERRIKKEKRKKSFFLMSGKTRNCECLPKRERQIKK